MFAGNWFGKKYQGTKRSLGRPRLAKGRRRKQTRAQSRSLRMEELEDRRLLVVYVVNNLEDLDANEDTVTGSLRHALELSNASQNEPDIIVFADHLFSNPAGTATPGTIFLDGRENGRTLEVRDEVQILGPGADALTIQATGPFRVFDISEIDDDDEFRSVTLGGMTITGGTVVGTSDEDRGGGIFSHEALTVVESIITGNSASQGGGGIHVPFGSLMLSRSLVSDNSSGGGGGGLLLGDDGTELVPSVTIVDSTISGNSTSGVEDHPGFGGGIFTRQGTTYIRSSTITQNTATAIGGGVATYGFPVGEENPVVITTTLTHSIVHGNLDIVPPPPLTNPIPDDVAAVFFDAEGELLVPVLDMYDPDPARRIGFNIIGTFANGVLNDFGSGGNNHYYQLVVNTDNEAISWTDANRVSGSDFGSFAHLATPSDAQQNDFIFELVEDPANWPTVEIEDDDPPPPAAGETHAHGPWLGGFQEDTSGADDAGWVWVTDPIENFNNFTAWALNQPDNAVQVISPEDEPIEEMYLAYFSPNGIPEPTWGDFVNEPDGDTAQFAFVIEYDQGSNYFGVDPFLLPLGDYGGAVPTFYPRNSPDQGVISLAVDGGDDEILNPSTYGGRGRHFSRVAGEKIDIGAVETQHGVFHVDTLVDESDRQYSRVWEGDLFTGLNVVGYEALGNTGGDFSLREALEFTVKNPEVDTIMFEPTQDPDILLALEDPTLASFAPTILLNLQANSRSALRVNTSVNIIGPKGFELEIDTSGTDPTPTVNNADGTRVFLVDDGDFFDEIDVTISDLTLLGGDVAENGGAIRNHENLTVVNTVIKENVAVDGGGVFSQLGELIVDSSTIHDNISTDDGGGIFVDTAIPGAVTKATVRNSTISGNSADVGGGIFNSNGEVLVEFSTITLNSAPSIIGGGGIATANGLDTLTQVHSSIVSGNLDGDVALLPAATNIQSLGFNLIGDGNAAVVFNQPGDIKEELDPMLAPLLNAGGAVPTHRILPGSKAIDGGDSLAVAGVNDVPEYDARGFPFGRVFDGLQDTKDRIDIGAYELQPTVFIVDTLVDENDGDISPGNFSLREAIAAANGNPLTDTITFAPTLFGGTIFQSAANSGPLQPGTPTDIRITDSLNIIGLGQSFLTFDGSGAQGSRFFTIDDGDNGTDIEVMISDVKLQNSNNTTDVGASIKSAEELTLLRVEMISNSTSGAGNNGGALYQRYGSLLLDGVSLSANSTDGVDADGGAVYIRDADLTVINNSSISGNSTSQTLGSGGGIYIRSGTLTLADSSVSGNLAPGGEADGSGIFGYEALLNISGASISGNSMTGSNSEGGGIFSKDSVLNLTNSAVNFNHTTGTQSEGAGIYISGGTATIDHVVISRNSSTGIASTGAAVAVVNGAEVLIHDTKLDLNTTTGINASGGAIHNLGGEVTLLNSTVSRNSVSGVGAVGGGIFSDTNLSGTAVTTITNSTVSGNSSAVAGGGVYNADGVTLIRHSTITNNSTPSPGFGGGVASYANSATTRTDVYSTIISGNSASDVDRVGGPFIESFRSLGYNLIGTGLSSSAFDAALHNDLVGITDPKLGPLVFNGGFANTHEVLEGSDAINAGDPNFSPFNTSPPLTSDQRGEGFDRVLAGRIDIGATESLFAPELAADFDSDGDVDGADFLAWQRGFGMASPTKENGDADNDDDVDQVDLGIFESMFGESVSTVAASTAPPTAPPMIEAFAAPVVVLEEADEIAEEPPITTNQIATNRSQSASTVEQNIVTGLTISGSSIHSLDNSNDDPDEASDEVFEDLLFEQFLAPTHSDDFGDIVSSSPEEGGEPSYEIEDHLFELLGDEA